MGIFYLLSLMLQYTLIKGQTMKKLQGEQMVFGGICSAITDVYFRMSYNYH